MSDLFGRRASKMSVAYPKHIIVITIPYFGHVIPAIALARNLCRFAKVTFAALRGSLAHIRARGELTIQDQQTFDVLGIDDGLPVGISEADYMKQIQGCIVDRCPHISRFVSAISAKSGGCTVLTDPVDAFIADIILAKDLSYASMQGIPYFLFHTGNIAALRNMLNVTENTPVCNASLPVLESFLMVRPETEGPQMPILPDYKKLILLLKRNLGAEKGILINSCWDIDQDGIQSMLKERMTTHGNFYCIGPMILKDKAEQEPEELLLQELVTAWLDRKPRASVMYISPGSVAQPSEEQVAELSKALQLLAKPYILSLPAVLQKFLPTEIKTAIASQFDGTDSQALVLKWAPQKIVLAHPAVQLFLSHCGWNSTIESIYFGIPVIGGPLFASQLEDAIFLEKIGMGISLVTIESAGLAGGEKKKIMAEDIIGAVRKIEDELSSYRKSAQQWSRKLKTAIASGGSSDAELRRLVGDCAWAAVSEDG